MMDKPGSPHFEQPPSPATRSLAEAGDAKAQFSLGFCFASEGSAPDYLQAAQWYQKAADQSHALAQFNLGVMYDRGQGILRDPVQSMIVDRQGGAAPAMRALNTCSGCGETVSAWQKRPRPLSNPGSRLINGFSWLQRKAMAVPRPDARLCLGHDTRRSG